MGWVKQETGVDLGSPQDWVENTSDAIAETGQVVSDAIHDVGTAVAKDPILSTAAYFALTPYVGPAGAAALLSANAGAKPETIVQNMILAGVAANVASSIAPEVASMTNKTVGNIAGQAASSAATAALTGRDPIQAATNALITGGITAGTSEVLGQVEGFSDLTPTQQRAVSSAVSAELQGKDPTDALIRGAINIAKEKVQDEIKYAKYDEMDFGVSQGTVDKLAELQAREVEVEDAARAAAEQRLAEEENIRQIEAARAEQGATDITINTEPAVDESYLSNLSPADLERYKAMQAGIDTVPDIKPQDLGISQESIDSYERTQQENADAGKLPSQWVPNQDGSGTSTMVHDDGSTTTIDDKGDIVYTTEAPPGSLISDKVTDETFTKLSTTQKSTALDMVKSGIPMNQAVKYVNSMGQTVSQPAQQVQQTQQTSSGTALSPLSPQYLTSTANKQGFVNPLSTYQRMVASDTAPLQPNPAPTQDTVQVSQGNVMPDYYSYGQNQSIDDILGITAKEGGLVTPLMAKGGSVQKYAEGGLSVPMMNHGGKMRGDFRHGAHVAGPGDGQSDDIPAMLADGEFVFPADVVSALGNGSTKAGSQKLYDMMHSIRDRARSKGPKDLPPPALKSPLDYLSKKSRS
jgi:hypothetical protein